MRWRSAFRRRRCWSESGGEAAVMDRVYSCSCPQLYSLSSLLLFLPLSLMSSPPSPLFSQSSVLLSWPPVCTDLIGSSPPLLYFFLFSSVLPFCSLVLIELSFSALLASFLSFPLSFTEPFLSPQSSVSFPFLSFSATFAYVLNLCLCSMSSSDISLLSSLHTFSPLSALISYPPLF